jgi:hypothetical protein
MADDSKTNYKQGDSDNNLLRKILARLNLGISTSGGGGGGGGGGAVTVADGADVTQGAKADAAISDPTQSGTVVSFIKGIISLLTGSGSTGNGYGVLNVIQSTASSLKMDISGTSSNTNSLLTNSVAEGAKADAAATDSTSAWSVIALLKGLYVLLTGTGTLNVKQATATNLLASVSQATAANLNATVVNANLDVALSTRLKPADTLTAVATVGTITNPVTVAQATAASLNATVVGNVGGVTTVIKDTTAVSTTPAYTAGDAVGAKRTIANAVRTAGTGILQSVAILDRANQKAAMTLFIFDADPTNATITDNAAFVFSTDDLKVIAQVSIGAGDYVTTNSKAYALISGLNIPLKAASGTSLFAALVTTGTPTYAATTDVQLEYGILQD